MLTVLLEQDADGYCVVTAAALKSYAQGNTFEELHPRIKEATELSLEEGDPY